MDLNGDGEVDILSGSYSRHDSDMAGLFQVLWGKGNGKGNGKGKREREDEGERGFAPPEVLKGTDGEPLIIAADKEHVVDKICTRPTAVDLDGDGKLDIVSGNFAGTFVVFQGEGGGRFAPEHRVLSADDGKPMRVDMHSDPFFVDWDADGDLDLVSGSGGGGVFLWTNTGSATQPRFHGPTTLWKAAGHGSPEQFGDAHVTGPQSATRVFVADVDADGKLDLLVGDSVRLSFPAKGLDEQTARKRLAEWNEKQAAWSKRNTRNSGEKPSREEMKASSDAFQKLWKERDEFMRSVSTGYVWVLYQK